MMGRMGGGKRIEGISPGGPSNREGESFLPYFLAICASGGPNQRYAHLSHASPPPLAPSPSLS